MDALAFLSSAKPKRHPIHALFGDEDFPAARPCPHYRHRARRRGFSFAVSVYPGEKLISTVRNELDTLLPAPCRIVVVENADPFVTDTEP